MVSTIIQRIGGAVAGAPVNTAGGGIIQGTNVTGTNDYVATPSPTINQYHPFQLFMIRVGHANTGACTLDFGPGAMPWRTPAGTEFASGDISPNLSYMVQVSEDESEFRTVAPGF